MRALLIALLCSPLLAAPALETDLKTAYDACHHWAGEIGGGESKEQIAAINEGVRRDCAAARQTVEKALRAKKRSEAASAYVLRVVDCCRMIWSKTEKRVNWNRKVASLCPATERHFRPFGPKRDPDGQATYKALCPDQAKRIYRKN